MTYVQANPGRFAVIAGSVELDGDVVRVDGRPLAELMRGAFAYDPDEPRLGHLVLTVEPSIDYRAGYSRRADT